MSNFNPMLANEGVLGQIAYPKIGSPKLNGVRGLVQGLPAGLVARSLKPIPNKYTRELFSQPELDCVDGELVVGDFSDEGVFSASTSGVMTRAGTPDVNWWVFDMYHPEAPFKDRIEMLKDRILTFAHPRITLVPHQTLWSDEEVVEFHDLCVGQGFEGLVLRRPDAPYLTGRGQAHDGGFLRYCLWLRSEARITGITERENNTNKAKINELGFQTRSFEKAGMVKAGVAGAFECEDEVLGWKFSMLIPTDKLQKEVWENPTKFLGALSKYKYRPPVKKGGGPRFPTFEGIRDPKDMS